MSGLIDEAKGVFDSMNGATSISVVDAANQYFKNGKSGLDLSVTTLSIVSNAITIDCAKTYFKLPASNFTSNVNTINFINVSPSGVVCEICIDMQQDATGGHAFVLPSSFKAVGSSDTSIQTVSNAKSRLIASTMDGGVTWEYVLGAVAT